MFLFIISIFSIFVDSSPYENYDYFPTKRFSDFEAEARNTASERRYKSLAERPRFLRKFSTHGFSNQYIGN